eukprot:5550446-Prorocentrum_lima.AAC.1
MSEAITKGWVDNPFKIWDRALSRPEIQAIVLAEESYREKSVFNSTWKMQPNCPEGAGASGYR